MCLLFFNTVIATLSSVISYPTNKSEYLSIGTGYYSYSKEYDNLEIESINVLERFVINNPLSKNDLNNIISKFEIEYFDNYVFTILNNQSTNGYALISRDIYDRYRDRAKILNGNIYDLDTSIKLRYKIYNEEFVNNEILIGQKEFENLVFADSIRVMCGLRENNQIKFNNEKNVNDIFSHSSTVTYISPSIFK